MSTKQNNEDPENPIPEIAQQDQDALDLSKLLKTQATTPSSSTGGTGTIRVTG